MSRSGSRSGHSPLVCIHGFSGSWRNWLPILPELAGHHEVHNLPLAGHADGPRLSAGEPANVTVLADHLERELDSRGVDAAHLVGNSLGGWLALKLASRGRALSVTALSPALGWAPTGRHVTVLKTKLVLARRLFAALSPVSSQVLRIGPVRRLALGAAVAHTESMCAQDAATFVGDNLRCDIYFDLMRDILAAHHDLGDITCPVQIAWSERDTLIPYRPYGLRFPELVPHAQFSTLPDVGHVPMYDNPSLVTRTVLEVTASVDRTAATADRPAPQRPTPPEILRGDIDDED